MEMNESPGFTIEVAQKQVLFDDSLLVYTTTGATSPTNIATA